MGPLTGRLSLDLRSLALFRMVLGLTLLIDHVWFRWGEALAFYGSEGLLSPETFERLVEADPHRSLQRFSLLHLADSEAWLYAVLTVATVVYLAFLLGWRTRISGLLSVMTLWSLHARNPYIVEAPDRLLMALLFWASFAPVDQRWAIRPSPDPGPGWTAASSGALQLQVVFLYLFNAYNKSGVTWTEGSAVQVALMEDLWLRHPTSGWLLDHPGWCELLTYGTVYTCLLYTSPSPRDGLLSRMPSSA